MHRRQSATAGQCRRVQTNIETADANGLTPCSSNTAAYCKARARLPQDLVETLARRTGRLVADGVCDGWLWRGRRVLLADGTTVRLPDTEENQGAYPQPASQRPGLGFPIHLGIGPSFTPSG